MSAKSSAESATKTRRTPATKKPMRKILISPLRGKLSDEEILAAIRGVHVLPRGRQWEVNRTGIDAVRRRFGSQERALEFARELGRRKKAAIYLHQADGKVRNIGNARG
jgi:hypothetical protein